MRSIIFCLAIFFAGITVAGGQEQEIKPVPGQAGAAQTENNVFATAAQLRLDGSGWISCEDVLVDHEGFAWIKADARVRTQKQAQHFAKDSRVLQISRTSKGHALEVPADMEWQAFDRDKIAGVVVPCMSWRTAGAVEPKAVTKPKGF